MKLYKVIATIQGEANMEVEADSMQYAEQIAVDSGIYDDVWDNISEIEPKLVSEEA